MIKKWHCEFFFQKLKNSVHRVQSPLKVFKQQMSFSLVYSRVIIYYHLFASHEGMFKVSVIDILLKLSQL